MTIEERQVLVDEIAGMIIDYFFERDIDQTIDVATQIVIRAASRWLAEYAANPEKDADRRYQICKDLGELLGTLVWAESCLIDERRASNDRC